MCGFLCIFRAFPVCALCSGVFSFLQSLPPPPCSPFQFVPLFHCVFHTFLVCVFCPVVSVFLVSVPPPFLQPLPFPFISLLCTPPDTCPIFSLCVFRSKLSFFLLFFTVLPISVLGLSVSLCACFQPRCPTFPVLFPLFPAAFPSSSSFVPAFSFPFSPLFSSPSFSI